MSSQQNFKGVVLTGFYQNNEGLPVLITGKDEEEQTSLLRRTGQYNIHSRAKNAAGNPPYNRHSSQDSLDELSMDDYWTELEHIQKTRCNDQEQPEEVLMKVPDEGELEEEWLKEAGLSDLIGDSAGDLQESMVVLSTLTRTQAAAVQKRVETVAQTLRKKNRHHQVPDVRDIFGLPSAQSEKISNVNETQPAGTSENGKQDVKSDGQTISPCGDDKSNLDTALLETDINLEISFSEQAAGLKDQSKSNEPHGDEDDALLPNFRIPQDKTGTTMIGDLASQDMKKVHSLALIELTALYDTFGIDFKSHKAVKIKIKESGLFGVPLTVLLEQDQKKVPGTKVPLILQKLISHIEEEGLDTEGLLRIPGSATRIKSLCQDLEAKFYEGTFAWDCIKQHDAASLLKFFIRELPHPLLTMEYLNAFITVQKLPTRKQQLQALNLLVLFLPEPSRDTLKTLLEFLQRVIDRKEKNKMTLNNIAVVMAPNLFMFKGFRSKNGDQQEFAMATGTANLMRLLIRYQDLLWLIPKFLMNQVRKQNTENQKKMSKDRAMKKLLKKMAYDREKHEKPDRNTTETDTLQGVIRVQAPQFSKVSMAIQLKEDLKASDVLASFLSQIRTVAIKREDLCLYEIGGNIGARCLNDETYMKDLYQLNPNAEWVIKSRSC
ncbi:rho GTPase-activating protein 18-like isoform X2 [Acipenser ruthenus]|uniref:rho GTPase-activating protein 18-like isoform X2 n=1 Tax=Acipenser ruthenus TaxID=7906 RepID=UPI002741BFD1|nr:rho GTPase-activating protein 18-like isoform X2 [Acipenser ruthenus]